ncbi:MAG TPA: 6-phosphogluconolactonase, partial [Chitinophagaceae bacterium]|nr:6-phosphogluconolactonase [Chitinophagaceae bacterium]
MEIHIYKTVDEVIEGLANYFVQTVNAAIKEKNECTVVLSGGNSPKKLYELLASQDYARQINWDKIYFFFGDERYVPFNDPGNNGNMVKNFLFEPLMIPDANIFYINTASQPDESAKKYSKRILTYFRNNPVRFDLILLGLGDNAHTASLFPHTPVLKEKKA